MKCDKYNENCILYIYDELKGKERKEFKEHLLSCPFCKKYIDNFKTVVSLYDRLPQREPSFWVTERILKRVERRYKRFTFRWHLRWAMPTLAGAVAILLILILPFQRAYLWDNNFEETIRVMEEEIFLLTEYKEDIHNIDTRIYRIENELLKLEGI